MPERRIGRGEIMKKEKHYIAPGDAWKMLRTAKSIGQVTYVYGATGFGKTELVRQFLGKSQYFWIDGIDGTCDFSAVFDDADCPKGMEETEMTVAVDNVQFIKDEEIQKQILSLAVREDIWLILIGRCPVPSWLIPLYLKQGMIVIGEEKLQLKPKEIAAYLDAYGVSLSPADLEDTYRQCQGNGYCIHLLVTRLLEGRSYDAELVAEIRGIFERYLESGVMAQWDADMVEFLQKVSVVDEFDGKLAEMITGNCHVYALLEKAMAAGNFLTEEQGIYRLRYGLLTTLRKSAEQVYGSDRIREFAYSAGLYYEMNERIPEALVMYEKSGKTGRIRELLIRNARCNPGNGHYIEMRRYYFALTDQDIEGNAVLMSGMSMLYSLLMQPDKSEYWYERLKAYEKQARGGEKREAAGRLVYLDIALPHRGSVDILGIMKKIPSMLFDKGISLPEFSVTSNIPSVMNGGKDFCQWSRIDRKLAATVGKLVERVLGRYGKGIVNIALGESLYEKGEDTCEVLSMLSRGQMETEAGGMPEMGFACVGLQARLNLLHGAEDMAVSLVASFEARLREKDIAQLGPNLEALKCRLALYNGNCEAAQRWLQQAPDENREFVILERYRYLTKIRCYLFLGEYMKAFALLEKLRYYSEEYKRTYIRMETGILMAVTRYRMGEKEWADDLTAALKEASGYHFVRLISEEGAAVLELLERGKPQWSACKEIDQEWMEQVMEETRRMAVQYPAYLKRNMAKKLDFSENALAILRLQADGLSTGEIAERLSMKAETVRYHMKQNYKKLGVSGKADAVLTARSLKLL